MFAEVKICKVLICVHIAFIGLHVVHTVAGVAGLNTNRRCTGYPKKYAHGFVVLCFAVVMQSFIMNSHEVFIHIYQGCFAGTGAIVRLPQCQWSKPDGYGKISQCITTTKHNKAKTMCIFLGIYCMSVLSNCGCPYASVIYWLFYHKRSIGFYGPCFIKNALMSPFWEHQVMGRIS